MITIKYAFRVLKGEDHLERSENRVFSEFFFSIKTTCHGKMFYIVFICHIFDNRCEFCRLNGGLPVHAAPGRAALLQPGFPHQWDIWPLGK